MRGFESGDDSFEFPPPRQALGARPVPSRALSPPPGLPLHGSGRGKRLNSALGAFRALPYGTLYPCLRDLVDRGWIAESTTAENLPESPKGPTGSGSRRARIVYEFTAEGKEHFQSLL